MLPVLEQPQNKQFMTEVLAVPTSTNSAAPSWSDEQLMNSEPRNRKELPEVND
jgi:hypothetical protein